MGQKRESTAGTIDGAPPPTPGLVLLRDVLVPRGYSQAQLAAAIGLSGPRFSEFLHGRRRLTAPIAWALAHELQTSPEHWMYLQVTCDLWKHRSRSARAWSRAATPKELSRITLSAAGSVPPHPGVILRQDFLIPRGQTQASLAAAGISVQTTSQLVHGHHRVNAQIAWRLAAAFDTTPEYWMYLQVAVDLWDARQNNGRLIADLAHERVNGSLSPDPQRRGDREAIG